MSLFTSVAPEHRAFAEANRSKIKALHPELKEGAQASLVREIVRFYFEHPEELVYEKPLPPPPAKGLDWVSRYPLPDEGVRFANEPAEAAVHDSLQLLDAFVMHCDAVIRENPRKTKQQLVIRMIRDMLCDHRGQELEDAIEFYMGTFGQRLSRINASTITGAINGLPPELRDGKTVTLPTVQAALQSLLQRIREIDGQAGHLRTRKTKKAKTNKEHADADAYVPAD